MQGATRLVSRLQKIYNIANENDVYAAVLMQSIIILILLSVTGPFGTYHHIEGVFERIYFWGGAVCLSVSLGFLISKLSFRAESLFLNFLLVIASIVTYTFLWIYIIRPCTIYDPSEKEHMMECMIECAINGALIHIIICFPLIICMLGWNRRTNKHTDEQSDNYSPKRRITDGSIDDHDDIKLDDNTSERVTDTLSEICVNSSVLPNETPRQTRTDSSKKIKNQMLQQELVRCKYELGGNIACVSAEDHYVRLYGGGQSRLVFGRFRDVVNLMELLGIDGIQIHRSWWVTASVISEKINENGTTTLVLICGKKVPVSRKYLLSVETFLDKNNQITEQ